MAVQRPFYLVKRPITEWSLSMIALTAVSGKEFYLNCELIYRVDRSFDTIITLTDGKTVRVTETEKEIVEKVIQYKRKIYNGFTEGEI
ncbi:flagellar FlbD family protein [Carnobacterium inhibens]|uniref:Endoflagellar protein n=2 Tax=Carnobacterium inhibens TaxID=147709 RepID=U5SAL9_9LACT|nr:flagellar FlbD family protein [Carnobacterium inhibens]AGY82339.1 endoflagellar protein [Carnobacterium inhibens subsp. gilichinskyi]